MTELGDANLVRPIPRGVQRYFARVGSGSKLIRQSHTLTSMPLIGCLGALAPDQKVLGLAEGAAGEGGETRGEGMMVQPPGSFGVTQGFGQMAKSQGASCRSSGMCRGEVNGA
jgi:hypothetical protein